MREIILFHKKLKKKWNIFSTSDQIGSHLNENQILLSKSAILLYAKYIELVNNDMNTANQTREMALNQANSLEVYNSEEGLAKSENGYLSVSANKTNVEQIISCSVGFCRISGYTKRELLQNKLSIILPSFLRESHSKWIKEECVCCENGGGILVNKEKTIMAQSFLKHKNGFIIPVLVKIVEAPHFLNNYCFIAQISLKRKDVDMVYIITDNEFRVEERSSEVYSFEVLKDFFSLKNFQHNIKLTEIIPDIDNIPEGKKQLISLRKSQHEERKSKVFSRRYNFYNNSLSQFFKRNF